MATTDLSRIVAEILDPLAQERGFELVAVEQAGGRRKPIIRVLIDREGGVDLEAICEANRWVGDALEASDPVSGAYTLEVSSPGVDRPLHKLGDFDRFAGETVTVKVRPHGEARCAWTGVLVGTSGHDVVIDVDGERVRLPHADIVKARIKGVVRFDRGRDEG